MSMTSCSTACSAPSSAGVSATCSFTGSNTGPGICGIIGLFTGRLGNFINGELWGKPTTVPWGFNVDGQVRHASQLYEAFFEGLLLFAILWWFTSKPRPRLAPSGLFLLIYGLSRFMIEFVRVPDEHIGYLAGGWFTMGQALSLPMIVVGAILMTVAYRQRVPSGNVVVAG
jgi:phosphatidylglycerol:prolipoprotein diacylglycerol transferase